MSLFTRCTLALLLAAPPVLAQRTPTRPTPQKKAETPPVSDTTLVRRTPAGFVLDFQNQELKVVLSALAEAGGLNVSLTNIPSKQITLRMGQPVSRDTVAQVLRGIAEANGLKVTQTPALTMVEGPAPVQAPTPQQQQFGLAQQLQQAQQAVTLKLYTYRLKHASAVQLAPVLMNLFTGAGGFNNGFNANGPQGFINLGGVGGGPGGNNNLGGNQAVGRGAARGAAAAAAATASIGQVQTPAAPNVIVNPAGGALANLIQGFAAQQGGLSASANLIRVVAEETTNSLLVRAAESDWALVQGIVQAVDVRPLQVLIEVTIAEVSRTKDLDVGVSGSVTRKKSKGTDSASTASQASARDFVLQLTGGNGTIDYNVALNALESRGDVRVLSLPVIIAQNNRQAVLNVGQSVPFVQVSQTVPTDPTGRVQTVQYQDVGTVLTITPTINPDGYVNLQVSQTDNSATNEVQFDAPVISKREATTQIFIHDGQTTVIGGLADNTRNHTTAGLPFLSHIPLIGPLLFGNVTQSDETSELFLFLTPHVINSDDDIDRLRNAVQNGSDLLKQVPVGPRFNPRADTIQVRDSVMKRLDSLRKADSAAKVKKPDGH